MLIKKLPLHRAVDKETPHSIWQVMHRWARRFDSIRAKILIFKKLFLQTEQKFFVPL